VERLLSRAQGLHAVVADTGSVFVHSSFPFLGRVLIVKNVFTYLVQEAIAEGLDDQVGNVFKLLALDTLWHQLNGFGFHYGIPMLTSTAEESRLSQALRPDAARPRHAIR